MKNENIEPNEKTALSAGSVRCRADINKEMNDKIELIEKTEAEIIELRKEYVLLCDEYQRFEEKEEEIIISRRPKKTVTRLIGRIYWKEEFKDEEDDTSIWIERNQVVRIDGVWE
jgi:sulfate adenylyltransferase subunit 1 (EFTu-like GTPase family)